MALRSPFAPSTSAPGAGTVHLTLLPPSHPVFTALSFSYPLKLVVSAPHHLTPTPSQSPSTSTTPATVPLLFLLTYGGGLVSGDHIALTLTLSPHTRLTIATQGSTKIFPPSSAPPLLTRQDLRARVGAGAALWLAPDACCPFKGSRYKQKQVFEVDVAGGGSVGLVDWVGEGRGARGEKWLCEEWRGGNEVWDVGGEEEKRGRRKRLVLRDNIILEGEDIKARVDGLGLFGTVILVGPLLDGLKGFFVEEFKALPRIGAKDWGDGEGKVETGISHADAAVTEKERREKWRKQRQVREKNDGLLWTAASIRGAVVVKFGAREAEGARKWLGAMLREEGTVEREFGPGGLICVK